MATRKPGLNDLRMCVDRVVEPHQQIDAAVLAMAENPENEPPPIEIRPGAALHPVEMALVTSKKWNNGRKLRIKFLDGSVKQKSLTQKYAEMWSQFANVGFDFKGGATAEIRISFRQPGAWSAVGTDSLLTDAFPKTQPTMNFGWLRDDTDEKEWRRVVLHEFGHALSAIHEHQSPKNGIKWNIKEVYRVFSGPPNNWSKEKIDFNIIQKYSVTQLNATEFDAKSIMLYAFPGNLIVGGKATSSNTDLSSADKAFIAEMYPKQSQPPQIAAATFDPGFAAAAAPPTADAPRPRFTADHLRRAAAHATRARSQR